MKVLLKTLFVFILLLKGFSLKAQKRPIVATCETGQGCTFQIAEATYEEFDVVHGTNGKYANMPKDAMVVFAKINGKWETFIDEKRSRSELDKFFGGDGYTKIYPFNPKLQPLDGLWKVDVGNPSTTPCFVDISSEIKSGLAGASTGGMVTFPNPFNVKFLMNNQNVKWRMINPSQYQGVLDFGGDFASPMKLVYDITLINEEKIKGLFTITIKVPTKDPCISKIPITYTCIKPNKSQRSKAGEIDPFATRKKFDVERLPDDPKAKADDLLPDGKQKAKPDLLPDKPKKPVVERLPDERKKPNVERLPNDRKPTADDLLPDGKRKPKPDLLPNKAKKPGVERLPDDRKRPNVARLPDDQKPKADDLLPNGKIKPKPDLLPDKAKKPAVERLPDDRKKTNVERL